MTPLWIIVAVLVVLAAYPLLVLAHELGHALVVLAYGRSVEAVAGDGERGARMSMGRLSVAVAPFVRSGYCAYDSNGLTIRQRRNVLLGGPLASCFVAVALGLGACLIADVDSLRFWVLAAAGVLAAVQTFNAARPRREARRHRTDGVQLRRLRSFESHYVPPHHESERVICKVGR